MQEVRGELGLGRMYDSEGPHPLDPSPLEAKLAISRLLDLPADGCARLLEREPGRRLGAATCRQEGACPRRRCGRGRTDASSRRRGGIVVVKVPELSQGACCWRFFLAARAVTLDGRALRTHRGSFVAIVLSLTTALYAALLCRRRSVNGAGDGCVGGWLGRDAA